VKRLVLLAGLLATLPASADPFTFRAVLSGIEEVPSVSTSARATLDISLDDNQQSLSYTLSFAGLQAPVTQAHIHFAQPAVNGPIIIWLCGTAALPGPVGTPTCPSAGTVRGTISAANVLASPPSQQLAAGDFARALALLRTGVGYANIHTVVSPGGEIRGQIE
jgi:hypothetical protein